MQVKLSACSGGCSHFWQERQIHWWPFPWRSEGINFAISSPSLKRIDAITCYVTECIKILLGKHAILAMLWPAYKAVTLSKSAACIANFQKTPTYTAQFLWGIQVGCKWSSQIKHSIASVNVCPDLLFQGTFPFF